MVQYAVDNIDWYGCERWGTTVRHCIEMNVNREEKSDKDLYLLSKQILTIDDMRE